MKSQQGFSIVPILLLAVIVGLVGIIGWRVFDAQKTTKNDQTAQVTTAPQVAPLKTKQDVEQVQNTLDTASIDSDLDTSGIDQDLNSLL